MSATGATAQTAGWSTSNTKILTPTGGEFVISGINWYGFETTGYVAHGLWAKDYRYILDEIRQYGYNTIRLPYSNEMWESNPVPAPNQTGGCTACSGKRARDIMAMIVNYAGSIGLHVILDNHRSNAGNSAQESGLWYTSSYPEQAWIRDHQLIYSAHDYGPDLYRQPWFNGSTCYATACSSSSLADIWKRYWAHVNLPGGINPIWPGHTAYPWANTGHTAVVQAPAYIGEFGTANRDVDLYTSGSGSQGQWMTSIVNFIQSSYWTTKTALNDSGVPVSDLHWTYWAINDEDHYAVLGSNYTGLENPKKEYSFLCYIQQGPLAVPMGGGTGQCSSTGTLPLPDSSAPVVAVPAMPTGLTATSGDAQVSLTWTAVSSATAYNVKASTTNGGPYNMVQAGVVSTGFLHTGLTNGVTYYYVVSATNTAGESADSSQASATPAPAAVTPPTGLTATAGDSQVQLSWTAVTGATGYNLKYSTTSGGPYLTTASGITATNFTHTGLTNGTTYYYYVVSTVASAGESANSSQVSATPLAAIQTTLSIWSPAEGATLKGRVAFQARMENMALTDYKMYWQVDGGRLNQMSNTDTGGPHKEASVDVTSWTWNGNGPYVVNFVAKNRKNKLIMQKSVTIYVAR